MKKKSIEKPNTNYPYIPILIALTIIGLALRLYHLDYNSLWLDEAMMVHWAHMDFDGMWMVARTADFHPPLFLWIEHTMLFFGDSEFLMRLVPAVLGAATIPIVYFLGKGFKDETVGIVAATLTTTSYFAIYYSQEAYSYSIVLFVFSLVLLSYFVALRKQEFKFWILFAALSALAFWTHYYTAIGLLVIYLHAFYTFRKDWNRIGMMIGIAVVTAGLCLPLLVLVVERYFTLSRSAPTYGVLGPILLQETFVRFSGFNIVVAAVFFILMCGGIVFLYRYQMDKNKAVFSVMFLVLPLIISVLLSSKITMNPRYLIFLLPIYFVLIAMWYPVIAKAIPSKYLLYGVMGVILIMNATFLGGYYTSYTKDDWRGVGEILPKLTSEGDIVVNVPSYNGVPLDYYYSNVTDGTLGYGADNSSQLEALKSNRTIYVITSDISAMDPSGGSLNWLYRNTKEITQRNGIVIARSV